MATVAKADVNEILVGENVYRFEDGTRQVTEAEKAELESYTENGGPVTITYEEEKKKTSK